MHILFWLLLLSFLSLSFFIFAMDQSLFDGGPVDLVKAFKEQDEIKNKYGGATRLSSLLIWQGVLPEKPLQDVALWRLRST